MNCLVDTHVLLWSLAEPERLDAPTRRVLENPDHKKYVSSVSFWEISLKFGLGKLHLGGISPEDTVDTCIDAGFGIMPLAPEHAASVYRLPGHDNHKDPFDRLLIWQCLQQGLTMLTTDARIREYRDEGLKLLL